MNVVLVDEVRTHKPKGRAGRYGDQWCHMTSSTGNARELHVMAVKIGLKTSHFQKRDDPMKCHYDLTPTRRKMALHYGAVFMPARDQVRMRADHDDLSL